MDVPFGAEFDASVALAAAPVALIVIAPDGVTIAFANDAFVSLTGYDPGECVGRSLDLIRGPGTDAAAFTEIVHALHVRDTVSRAMAIRARSGDPIGVTMATRPHASGGGATVAFWEIAGQGDDRLADMLRNVPCRIFRRVRTPDGRVECHGLPDGVLAPGRDLRTGDCDADIHPDDVARFTLELDAAAKALAPVAVEHRGNPASDAAERWMRTYAAPRRDGEATIWDAVTVDVTVEKERTAWLDAAAENIPGFIYRRQTEQDGSIVYPYLSPSITRAIGLPAGAVAGDDLYKRVHPDDVDRLKQEIRDAEREMRHAVIELRMMLNGDEEHWFRSYSSPRRLRSGRMVWDGVAVDVTSEKEASLRLEYLARHDALTGLSNRSYLAEQLASAIDAEREAEEGSLVLSHIVLAGLSEINETLGTAEGDAVLREAASRIGEVASLQGSFAARIGGNEFAVLRRGANASGDALVVELIQILSQPIPVDDGSVLIEPSAGTAEMGAAELKRLGGDRAAPELMKRASMALSAACRLGAGSHLRYDDSLDHRIQHRMQLRHALHRAIEDDQLVLHYQPQVDLGTGRIVGAEALVRWQHPQFGLLRPNVFIPLAEESGLIGAVGEWVMRTGLRQLASWQASGIALPRLAVNASAMQIAAEGFADSIRHLLEETGVAPEGLEVELTEGILLECSEQTIDMLRRIRDIGVRVAIDDFGAGHASFQYLRGFPIDQLKLDQMFVRQLAVTSSDAVIVRAIASLARSLGLELIAEGVETRLQRDFLIQQGYALGQGYFFSPPVTAAELERMLAGGGHLPAGPRRHSGDVEGRGAAPAGAGPRGQPQAG